MLGPTLRTVRGILLLHMGALIVMADLKQGVFTVQLCQLNRGLPMRAEVDL
jgi:hypothetical protein